MTETRVRFAPSPTGYLHVGGFRTALSNYLFSANSGGKLILRIEDTDQSRKVEDSQENLLKSLDWTGIQFDEGPHVGGDYGPYIQSERLELYEKHARQLIDQKDAYYCFCTEKDLKKMRDDQLAQNKDTSYNGRCRNLDPAEVEDKLERNTPHVVRMKIVHSKGDYVVNDLIRGEVQFGPSQIDDQIILKSDGFPTYHLAVVVDDHLMKISHVIRGEEWLPSTPKHIQLYEYFGWEAPIYVHLPLILNPDRSKLSKRQGDVAVEDYRTKGFLPECLTNFVSLLGWHTQDDQEIFSLKELIDNFSLDRVGKAGAVFDIDKLRWMNQQYIKQKSLDELFELLQPYLPDYAKNTDDAKMKKIIHVVRDSLVTLPDIADRLGLFFEQNPELEDESLVAQVKSDEAQEVYKCFTKHVEAVDRLSAENFGQIMKTVQKETGIKGKKLWVPMRIAVTLVEQGPDLTAVVDIFGKEKCLQMVGNVLDGGASAEANSGDNPKALHFIRSIIAEDIKNNKNDGRVVTRFPPEPSGYLHIGHAFAICLDFGMAGENDKGKCYLRFDDTNPTKESEEYMESIKSSIRWLGFDWEDRLTHASDYFDQLYEFALQLVKKGKAYVCSLSADEIRKYRGTLTEPGQASPYRNRTVEENLDLFQRMKAGEFEEGEHVLRAKIDMRSPNIIMRDPVLYRILKVPHHRTGDKWCIYPLYDFTHCLSDSLEGITHSLCSLEFENNRPLYDWVLDELERECHPQQIEFSRLNLNYTVTSKRKLNELVQGNYVNGWDDPRMPTLDGMRRRGYTSETVIDFCERVGVTKKEKSNEMSLLETCIREDLDKRVKRVMGVLRPLRLVIDNYPEDQTEELEAPYHPNNPEMGTRKMPFSRVLYIEQDDFREDPPKKFFRLGPGREVRLRYAYFVKCTEVVKDEKTGEIIELRCTYDPDTKSGTGTSTRKVKGTIHWVSAEHAIKAETRLYDRLFTRARPTDDKNGTDFKDHLNPNSIEILPDSRLEPALANAAPESKYQFERQGYFCVDSQDSSPEKLVFNRTVTLRDSWAKIEKAQKQ
ncbi:MAG: glutamine--tRNA ligase/YqeY domain fusion protein [Proteobacteria bacterium]|nr:glutamine--tRNA ligase/YqeY domain fusion protein [Pseudomonadota bacterium]